MDVNTSAASCHFLFSLPPTITLSCTLLAYDHCPGNERAKAFHSCVFRFTEIATAAVERSHSRCRFYRLHNTRRRIAQRSISKIFDLFVISNEFSECASRDSRSRYIISTPVIMKILLCSESGKYKAMVRVRMRSCGVVRGPLYHLTGSQRSAANESEKQSVRQATGARSVGHDHPIQFAIFYL